MRYRYITISVLFLSTFVINVVSAGDWDLGLAVGVGKKTNPFINSKDIDIYWLVDIAYYGDYVFFDNGDLGLTFIQTPSYSLSSIVSINTDRVYFSHMNNHLFNLGTIDAGLSVGEDMLSDGGSGQVGEEAEKKDVDIIIPDRDIAIEAGIELIIEGEWGMVQTQFNGDISNTHNGVAFWFDYRHDYIVDRWLLTPSLGISWRSGALNNYYYGIDAPEDNASMPGYQAQSGINGYVQFSASYVISKKLRWVNVMQYERINSQAANSPIMADNKIMTMFTGLFYSFL